MIIATKYQSGRVVIVNRLILKTSKTPFVLILALRYVELTSIQQNPSIEDIAYAIAEKDKARIIPSGLTALNKLGLSTQVTMNAVYLTDATARELTIGNRKIIFKRSAPRNFAYKTDLFPLIVAAMKELGKDNVTDEQVAIIKQAIEKYGSPDEIKYDYSIAPQWIKQRLAL